MAKRMHDVCEQIKFLLLLVLYPVQECLLRYRVHRCNGWRHQLGTATAAIDDLVGPIKLPATGREAG